MKVTAAGLCTCGAILSAAPSAGAAPTTVVPAHHLGYVPWYPSDSEPFHPAEPDPTLTAVTVPPGPNGTKIRINVFPPGAVSPAHRTQSVDYGIMLDGEVVLVLDDSETVLRAGDVVVQRGTSHRWENRSQQTARMAFILVDGCFTAELLDSIGGDVLGGLLHDPMKGES